MSDIAMDLAGNQPIATQGDDFSANLMLVAGSVVAQALVVALGYLFTFV
jgi:hypothetical protein